MELGPLLAGEDDPAVFRKNNGGVSIEPGAGLEAQSGVIHIETAVFRDLHRHLTAGGLACPVPAGCLPRADDAPGLRPGEDGGDGACVLIEGAVELQGLAAVYIQHTDHGTVPASGAGDLKDWGSGVRGGELIGEQIALRAALKGDGGKDAA